MGRSSKHKPSETDTGQESALGKTSKLSKLSFTRKGHQRSKSTTQDEDALKIPDLAEYKDLFNDDDVTGENTGRRQKLELVELAAQEEDIYCVTRHFLQGYSYQNQQKSYSVQQGLRPRIQQL